MMRIKDIYTFFPLYIINVFLPTDMYILKIFYLLLEILFFPFCHVYGEYNVCTCGNSEREKIKPHKNWKFEIWENFFFLHNYVLKLYLFRNFLDLEADKFIENNPEVAVYKNERRGRDPRLVASYCK